MALCLALLLASVVPLGDSAQLWNTAARLQLAAPQPADTVAVTAVPSPTTIRPPPRPPVRLTASNTVLAFPGPPIMARAAFLVDIRTGKVLFAKNADARLPMASTTKITTAVVALQRARLTDMVTASNRAATIGESTMSLRRGERLSVRDLLYGLMLNSGNDAAVALAEKVGGSEAHFVALMNALARTLHMTNTRYATPHGLDAPHHYTSARDLATVTLYAMRDPVFRRIVATTDFHIPKTKHNQAHWLGNINKALYWYPGVDGVKPGDTDAAGLCQVVSTWRNGRHVLAVLLHTPNLATDVRNLLNMGTRDFVWVPSIFAYDTPSTTASGGAGQYAWRYFYGAGHYVRGAFRHYFDTHGGLLTLGFPRTEQLQEDGRLVQYFQGAELVYDPAHDSVYPEPLGKELAKRIVRSKLWNSSAGRGFAPVYRRLGGRGVLGAAVTPPVMDGGMKVQFFEYGELASVNRVVGLVPLGDAVLRVKGWLPAVGAGNIFPTSMIPGLENRYAAPRSSAKRAAPGRPAPAKHKR